MDGLPPEEIESLSRIIAELNEAAICSLMNGADHFSPPVKKSGGTERIPSGGAGSHVTGLGTACAGGAVGGRRASVGFLPGGSLLSRFRGCVGGAREDAAGKG